MQSKRKDYMLFYVDSTDSSENYEIIGKDNDELSRTLNNKVEAKKNILGETNVMVTQGPQTSTIDPCYYRTTGKLHAFLKSIYWEDKELDEVVVPFMEVDVTEEAKSGEYKAFKQKGAVDLKSWGGDTNGISEPFDINWLGPKTYGTFNPSTKKFTETVSA